MHVSLVVDGGKRSWPIHSDCSLLLIRSSLEVVLGVGATSGICLRHLNRLVLLCSIQTVRELIGLAGFHVGSLKLFELLFTTFYRSIIICNFGVHLVQMRVVAILK